MKTLLFWIIISCSIIPVFVGFLGWGMLVIALCVFVSPWFALLAILSPTVWGGTMMIVVKILDLADAYK